MIKVVNEFIEKTIKMLQRSDIIIHMPEHRKLLFLNISQKRAIEKNRDTGNHIQEFKLKR